MADAPIMPFVMHGARDAVAGGLLHIEEQVKSIEQAVVENPGLAFDLAKTLVESVCRAVLDERAIPFAADNDLPKLFKTASQALPFLPVTSSAEPDVRRSLAQTLSGLSTAIQGICELRNQCGFASHESGSPRPAMETIQALMAAEAADTIVGFLHRVHRQNRPSGLVPRMLYDEHSAFNDYVDESHDVVRVFNEEFLPSRILFELASEPYRVYLSEFDSSPELGDEDGIENETDKVAP